MHLASLIRRGIWLQDLILGSREGRGVVARPAEALHVLSAVKAACDTDA